MQYAFAYHDEFEKLCMRLLAEERLIVERRATTWPISWQRSVTLAIRWDTSIVQLVDVKWASVPDINLERLRNWASQAAKLPRGQGKPSLLISSGRIEVSRQRWAEAEFGVEIWDRNHLLQRTENSSLSQEFIEFFSRTDALRKASDSNSSNLLLEFEAEFQHKKSKSSRGEELITRLTNIEPGIPGAKDYENICQDVIGYLFGDHLADARSQERSEDGLNVYDIVYRVNRMKPHPFWEVLTRDFRTRAILFECKNYSKPITPMQVYTTERYLSIGALRSVCFIFTRQAPHEHTELAAFGAMRESGKLFIFISDKDIEAMLRVRDAQLQEGPDSGNWDANDPTILLDQKIYDFIARLPR